MSSICSVILSWNPFRIAIFFVCDGWSWWQLLLLMVAFAVGLPSDLHPIESTVTGPRLEYNCNTGLAVEDIRVDLTQQREDLTEIIFRNCNLTELDFGFLAGFPDLRFLHVDGGSLVEFTGMPYVRDLTRAYIWTPDLRKWWGPGLTPQLWELSLKFIADDATINSIVDAVLPYKETLQFFYVYDSYFTTFPQRIREFTQLKYLTFSGNHQISTLTNGTFPASFTPISISFRDSSITMVEPGTFSGDTDLYLFFFIRFSIWFSFQKVTFVAVALNYWDRVYHIWKKKSSRQFYGRWALNRAVLKPISCSSMVNSFDSVTLNNAFLIVEGRGNALKS